MSENRCPHGVERRKWAFDGDGLNARYDSGCKLVVIRDADACPDCLLERIKNLRQAFFLIFNNSKPPDNVHQRPEFERGMRLYQDDLAKHL